MALTQEELRVVLRTVDESTGPLRKVRQEVAGLRKETEKSGKPVMGQLGLSRDDLIRGGAALVGLSAGLNLAASAAGGLHSSLTGASAAAIQAARTGRAVEAAYGAQTGEVLKFTDALSKSTGSTRESLLTAALSARTLAQNYGLTIEQTQKLITASADLANVRGIDVSAAFERVQSAIRGEAEASEYLGLTLNDTFLKTKGLTETMTDAEKAQIRYSEVLRQSAQFSGLAQKGNEGLEGAQKRLALATEAAGKTFGEIINPGLSIFTNLMADAVKGADDFIGRLTYISRRADTPEALKKLTPEIKDVAGGFDRFGLVKGLTTPAQDAAKALKEVVDRQERLVKMGAARMSLMDLDTEEKLLPITLKRIVLERQSADDRAKLLDITNQITDAQQERLDLTVREAQLTLEELPAKQRLAELDRQITDSTDKRLSLQLRLRELLERQSSAPGRNALEDLRFEREDTLAAYRTGGMSRADARAKLMDLKKAEPGLEREVALSDRRLQLIGREQSAEEIRSELARLGLEQEQIEERKVLDQLGRKRDALDTERAVHAANTTLKVADLERERQAIALVVKEHDRAIDALDREVKQAEALALAYKAMVSPEILDARRKLLEIELQTLDAASRGTVPGSPVGLRAGREDWSPVTGQTSGASGGTSNPSRLSGTVIQNTFHITQQPGQSARALADEVVRLLEADASRTGSTASPSLPGAE